MTYIRTTGFNEMLEGCIRDQNEGIELHLRAQNDRAMMIKRTKELITKILRVVKYNPETSGLNINELYENQKTYILDKKSVNSKIFKADVDTLLYEGLIVDFDSLATVVCYYKDILKRLEKTPSEIWG